MKVGSYINKKVKMKSYINEKVKVGSYINEKVRSEREKVAAAVRK